MPTRLLREGINDSEAVNRLTAPEEVFYRRLMSVVDDFGRFDGRAAILKGRLFALKPEVRETDISRWIAACEKAGLIALYLVAGKPYILFHKLGEPRAKHSKYPPPSDQLEALRADVNTCAQTQADVPYSYSDSDAYSDASSPYSPEPGNPAAVQDTRKPMLVFPCVGSGEAGWPLYAEKVSEWATTYPGIDINAEVRKAYQWIIDNPTRRKTARGMTKYLNGWLERAQNRGSVMAQARKPDLETINAQLAAKYGGGK